MSIGDADLRLLGRSPEVRRRHDAWMQRERIVGRGRLGVPDIDRGPGDLAGRPNAASRATFLDNTAPCDIDQPDAGLS